MRPACLAGNNAWLAAPWLFERDYRLALEYGLAVVLQAVELLQHAGQQAQQHGAALALAIDQRDHSLLLAELDDSVVQPAVDIR